MLTRMHEGGLLAVMAPNRIGLPNAVEGLMDTSFLVICGAVGTPSLAWPQHGHGGGKRTVMAVSAMGGNISSSLTHDVCMADPCDSKNGTQYPPGHRAV